MGVLLIGLVLASGGCLTISACDAQATWVGYVVGIVLYGLGVGVFISSNNSAVMGTAPKERLGIASGLLSLSRTLGQTTGLAIMGVLFSILTMIDILTGLKGAVIP
jgi:MFS family permease